jgi:hypothetical protein
MSPCRNGFVILRTGRSPPAAPHPASRRMQLHSVTDAERASEEDLHLPDSVRSWAHARRHAAGRVAYWPLERRCLEARRP